ncbi:hypothetical protein JOE21_002344 [Desmospora profundinema]|uniref:Uncharacterized protein n=1 Tax=Desmospora profundinema TaxID=1571184 RepID=A0ABU1IPL3_9BACL|nr:hypothetical protein [Desmospora profundinema]
MKLILTMVTKVNSDGGNDADLVRSSEFYYRHNKPAGPTVPQVLYGLGHWSFNFPQEQERVGMALGSPLYSQSAGLAWSLRSCTFLQRNEDSLPTWDLALQIVQTRPDEGSYLLPLTSFFYGIIR